MTEIRHIRCDRCDFDVVVDYSKPRSVNEDDWADVRIGLKHTNFCPECWKIMCKLAGVKQ